MSATWPRIEPCPRCGADVLRARHGRGGPGRGFVLELPEVLPRRRHSTGWTRGEDVTRGRWRVAVNWESGAARALGAREQREPGEAVCRRHRCG